MKKIIKYFSLLLMILVVSACGSKKEDPKVILENAVAKYSEVKSYSVKGDAKLVMEADGTTVAMNIVISGQVDENENMHMTLSMSAFGMSQTMEMYIMKKDNTFYQYVNDGSNGWYYMTEEITPETEETLALQKEMEDILSSATNVKEEKSDKKGYTKLIVTIQKDGMNNLLKEMEKFIGEEVEFTLEKDIETTLYIKDGYISIVEMDLSDLMQSLVSEEEELPMDITYTMTYEMLDVNKVEEIIVPDEVVENAVSYDELYYEEGDLDDDLELDVDPTQQA